MESSTWTCFDTFVSARIKIKRLNGLHVSDQHFFDIEFRVSSMEIFQSLRKFVRRCIEEHPKSDNIVLLCKQCVSKLFVATSSGVLYADKKKIYTSGEVFHTLMETIKTWNKCKCKLRNSDVDIF